MGFLNDLLPLPYTDQTLNTVAAHIDQAQNALGRQMLLENPSNYLAFKEAQMPEVEFLTELVERTGCGLLLDANNVFISCLLYTSPSPRDGLLSRMPSSA